MSETDPSTTIRTRVQTRVVSPADLDSVNRERMYRLMSDHFANIDRDRFDADLADKDWVIVIADSDGVTQGFTTLKVLTLIDEHEPIVAFYSGDTVLSPAYWGEHGWLRVWSQHVFAERARRAQMRCCWVLLTATDRTYRFLPAFFREYYPSPDWPTPLRDKRILDAFVRQRFPDEYDEKLGVVRMKSSTPVKEPDVVQSLVSTDDRFARYFCERNPGYLNSDFLACLTWIERSNVTRLGQRVLGGSG